MGLYALWQTVVKGAQVEGALEGAEGALDILELLLAQGHVLARQAGVGGRKQVLAVEARSLVSFLRLRASM